MFATPIKDYTTRRPTHAGNLTPSRPSSKPFFDSPLLTPSPHRNSALFQTHPEFGGQNSVDGSLRSPFHTPSLHTASYSSPGNEESGSFVPRRQPPLLTPTTREPQSPSLRSARGVSAGMKRPAACTPLSVTSRPTTNFDRLAPLTVPKPGMRTPQTYKEADASLRVQTSGLTHLNLDKPAFDSDDDDSGCDVGDPPIAVLFSKKVDPKRRSSKTLFSSEREAAKPEAISPDGHVTKRRHTVESPTPAPRVSFPTGHHRRKSSDSGSSSHDPMPRQRARLAGLNGPTPARPSTLEHRAPMARVDSATLFFGGPSLPTRARTDSSLSNLSPTTARPSSRPSPSNRHSFAGTAGSAYWTNIQSRSMLSSPQSSPPSARAEQAHDGTDDDDDMFSDPLPSDPHFKLTLDTPPPRTSNTTISSKFNPLRDSGISLSDDDMSMDSSHSAEHLMPQPSTSVSSICSDADEDGLVTPGVAPSSFSGWPQARVAGEEQIGGVDGDVNEFIIRTLTTTSKVPAEPKRAPGTPVKKVKTSYLSGVRPWQSAVAHHASRDVDWEVQGNKMPRKSLPLDFFSPIKKLNGKSPFDTATDSEDDGEDSPSRRKEKYSGLGLGRPRPPISKAQISRPRPLTRRSSSGAFSNHSEISPLGTPTRSPLKGRQSSISPTKRARLATSRHSSGSSMSSILSSPTRTRTRTDSVHARPSYARQSIVVPRPSLSAAQEQRGRFDRDFIVLEELGSGEFGKVIKARAKATESVYAIKQSKRYEGVKHRERLLEEADILRHLRAANHGDPHPNVLSFMDSWEEDDMLYIQTELCDHGSLSHFLWEYGRVYPRLEEARVWKIIADLSNGLLFIHDSGAIHLDLKPANILITFEGRFKIGDFGMASLWPRPATTGTPTVPATPFEREGDKLYLAPEVLQGKYGKAADVFSFGMTMLETATNIIVPDQGHDWHRLRRGDFSQIDFVGSAELLEIIQMMMRYDPVQRLSARDVYDHRVVYRARSHMEEIHRRAKLEGTSVFAASALATVEDGFLDHILERDVSMDMRF
ncbi:hypothetical protein CYLTODRAFT_398044 [Cylindrobasidium torrendii FP15055 ss-10]|uniref:Protein kinase domain-containing protein n=1 Tax=Cylindrobasidium torrendii FP15055 ss-10 TaxID=1314674 RepID=A0A0D7B8S0_9AGAR|nr:hypothetical protein CYLTODRAFT_398044 [Cylindrobasidium torrendii FP15055 ss-10]